MRRLGLVITAVLSLAGCEYESPLATEPAIPIDRAILGVWDTFDDSSAPHGSHEGPLVVLEFSPREYLVRDPDKNMFRGYLVDIGGHRCLQLQAIGSDAGPPPRGAGYIFGTYAIDGDRLTFNLINDTHVPRKSAKTTADIRAAILAKRDVGDLFTPLVQMRRRILPTLRLAPPSLDDQQAGRDFVETARIAPGGQRLVVGLRSGHIAVVDLVDGTLAWSVRVHDKPVRLLAFGHSDRWILSAGDDLQATLQSGATGTRHMSFEAVPLRAVYDIALAPDARFAATRGFDGFAKVQDLRINDEACALLSRGLAFSPDGRLLVSTPQLQPGAEIIRIPPGLPARRILEGHRVNSVAIDPSSSTVAATGGTDDGLAIVWLVEAAEGRTVREIRLPQPPAGAATAAHAVAFSAEGKRMVVATSDERIVCIDVATGTILDTWRVPAGSAPHRIGFVEDAILVTARSDSTDALPGDDRYRFTTHLFHPDAPEAVWTIAGEASCVAEQKVAAAVTENGDLVLLNRVDGKPYRCLRPFAGGTRWSNDPIPREPR